MDLTPQIAVWLGVLGGDIGLLELQIGIRRMLVRQNASTYILEYLYILRYKHPCIQLGNQTDDRIG